MQPSLEHVAQSQGRWSATASRLKTTFERVRAITFGVSILATLGAAVASQLESPVRTCLAVVSAILFAIGGVLSKQFLGGAHAQEWVRARAASEQLKRVAYTFAAGAAPYDVESSRDKRLVGDVAKIEQEVNDLRTRQAPPTRGSTPAEPLDPAAYRRDRVQHQVDWYEENADITQRSSEFWRNVELVLALLTAVLTAILGVLHKQSLGQHGTFDWVALVGVLTTISGVVLAHVEASRFDFQTVSYRSAAHELRTELALAPPTMAVPGTPWSSFVARCEAILAQQNGSWATKFGKGMGGAKRASAS